MPPGLEVPVDASFSGLTFTSQQPVVVRSQEEAARFPTAGSLVQALGVESFAMLPTASVSGFYLSHPESRYFAIGKIERDQVADYAHRKGMDIAQVERWLAPILNY